MRRYLIAVALPWFAACATAPAPAPAPDTQVASEQPMHCYKEMRVGSTIPVMTCREAVSEADRQTMIDGVKSSFKTNAQSNPH